eukprot:Nk52_evm5s2377 gene=Nk52_evmTU5s2377
MTEAAAGGRRPYLQWSGLGFILLLLCVVYVVYGNLRGESEFINAKLRWAQALVTAQAECDVVCVRMMSSLAATEESTYGNYTAFCPIGCASALNGPVKANVCDHAVMMHHFATSKSATPAEEGTEGAGITAEELQRWYSYLGEGFCPTMHRDWPSCLERQLTAILWCHAIDHPGDLASAAFPPNPRDFGNARVRLLLEGIFEEHKRRWEHLQCTRVCNAILEPVLRIERAAPFTDECARRCGRWSHYPGRHLLCPATEIPVEGGGVTSTEKTIADVRDLYESVRLPSDPNFDDMFMNRKVFAVKPLSAHPTLDEVQEWEEAHRSVYRWKNAVERMKEAIGVLGVKGGKGEASVSSAWREGINCCSATMKKPPQSREEDMRVCTVSDVFPNHMPDAPDGVLNGRGPTEIMPHLGSRVASFLNVNRRMCELVARLFCFAIGKVGLQSVPDSGTVEEAARVLDNLYVLTDDQRMMPWFTQWPDEVYHQQMALTYNALYAYVEEFNAHGLSKKANSKPKEP